MRAAPSRITLATILAVSLWASGAHAATGCPKTQDGLPLTGVVTSAGEAVHCKYEQRSAPAQPPAAAPTSPAPYSGQAQAAPAAQCVLWYGRFLWWDGRTWRECDPTQSQFLVVVPRRHNYSSGRDLERQWRRMYRTFSGHHHGHRHHR